MAGTDSETILTELQSPDPAARAAAIGRVRYRDLKVPAVLRALLLATTDPTPAPGVASASPDPFAAFFEARSTGASLGELASERLHKAGLPEDEATALLLAELLAERAAGTAHALPALVARQLGEAAWWDAEAAVRLLVPPLQDHDVPLFEALVRLPSATWPALVDLAVGPLRPRLLQELLNHPPTHELVVEAVGAAVLEDRLVPSADEALLVLGALAAWSEPSVPRIAAHLSPRLPFAAAWGALEDPAQLAVLGTWLAGGAEGLAAIWSRLAEVLRHRDPVDGYPLAELIRRAGSDPGVVAAWGLDADPELVGVLSGFVLAHAEDPDRAWAAIRTLVAAERHAPVLAAIGEALADRDPERCLPWERRTLELFARAMPELPGFDDAVLAGLAVAPDAADEAVSALLARSETTCRRAATLVLDAAAAAPRETVRVGPAAVREGPRGFDVSGLGPWVSRIGDPDLTARWESLVPVVRGARPQGAGPE